MSFTHPVPESVVQWVGAHVADAVELPRNDVLNTWKRLRETFNIRGTLTSSILDHPTILPERRGRGGRRRWSELLNHDPRVILVFSQYTSGWMGLLGAIEDRSLNEQIGDANGDIVFVHPEFEWAFVSSDHAGEALLSRSLEP